MLLLLLLLLHPKSANCVSSNVATGIQVSLKNINLSTVTAVVLLEEGECGEDEEDSVDKYLAVEYLESLILEEESLEVPMRNASSRRSIMARVISMDPHSGLREWYFK